MPPIKPTRPSFEQIVSANVDKTAPELAAAISAVCARMMASEISDRLRALAAEQAAEADELEHYLRRRPQDASAE